eukprot:3560518-Pleurochrysis_carterae.AAC.1
MQASGVVIFTAGRDVVKPDTAGRGGGLIVQLHDAEGGDVLPLSVAQLLAESDGVLQGVLTYDRRRGEAAPALR